MTEEQHITLRKVSELPLRLGTRYSKWDELLHTFFNSDWRVAKVEGWVNPRAENVRQQITKRINAMGLGQQLRAHTRRGEVYIVKIAQKPGRKPKPLVIEAGVGIKKGTALDEEISA